MIDWYFFLIIWPFEYFIHLKIKVIETPRIEKIMSIIMIVIKIVLIKMHVLHNLTITTDCVVDTIWIKLYMLLNIHTN